MKKMLIATAALALVGMAAQAAEVTSSNVVGYQKLDLKGNDYTMLAINFQGVGGGDISIQDYFKGDFVGGASPGESDNLIVWTAAEGYVTYFYGVYNDPENPEWDDIWYTLGEEEATATYPAGTAAWLLRRGAATSVTAVGEVSKAPVQITVKANDYTMFSCPYPVAVPINGGLEVANPTGGASPGESDNLIVWTAAEGYVTYFYGVYNDPENPEWDDIWYTLGEEEATTSLGVGQAAWYLRRGAQTTLSFTSPIAD